MSAAAQPVGKGGFIGNVPLGSGTGQFVLALDSIPDGNVNAFSSLIQISGAISTAAAFALSVTGAPGDDLNLILADIISNASLFYDSKRYAFNTRAMQDIRVACGLMRAGQDWGQGLNGLSIPVSSGAAITLPVLVTIPMAVPQYFRGGQATAQGSARFRSGGRFLVNQIKQANTSLTLANGDLKYTAWSWAWSSLPAKGPATWVGPTWRLEVVQGYANSVRLDEETYLFLAFDYSAATMTTDGVPTDGINVDGQDKQDLAGPLGLAGQYTSDHPTVGGGVDFTQYVTPAVWIREHEAAQELPAPQRTKLTVPALSTLNVFSIAIDQTDPTAKANVAQMVGAGGATSEATPPIVGTPAGSAVPNTAASFLPTIIAPPGSALAATGTPVASPAKIALSQTAKNAMAGQPAMGAAGGSPSNYLKRTKSVGGGGSKARKSSR